MTQTKVLPYDSDAIAEAGAAILAGQPVAVPTETVYGLAADATNAEAVARIYAAKGRPTFNPLIVHVRDLEHALSVARFEKSALELAIRFWPGPVTLVLPLGGGASIASLVTAGLDTVALRCPAHPAMQDLLNATQKPLAAPSANASGRISPTRADHVLATLGGRIPLIIDAGPTSHGLESTIIAVEEGQIRLLRPGPVYFDAELATGTRIESPGQLASHYAPSKPLRLDATSARSGEWLIGFGPVTGDGSLSETGDLIEAAATLFDRLHQAEAAHPPRIAVAPVPDHGLGQAINDRLRRAAAPRPGA